MNKIVFVVNIWRVHSGVPPGLCERNSGRAWRWGFLRERKKSDVFCRVAGLRALEIQQLPRIFLQGGLLLQRDRGKHGLRLFPVRVRRGMRGRMPDLLD